MDTPESLYKKYVNSLRDDIKRGCYSATPKTQQLLAFYQEVEYRLSQNVEDEVTANTLLEYTFNNYE